MSGALRRPFSRAVTFACAAVVAAGIGWRVWDSTSRRDQLVAWELSEPLEQEAGKALELSSAIAVVPRWELWFHGILALPTLADFTRWHQQWAAERNGELFRLPLGALYGAAGRTDLIRKLVEEDPDGAGVELLELAYLERAQKPERGFLQARDDTTHPEWFLGELTIAWYGKTGETALAQGLAAARELRRAELRSNARLLTSLEWTVMLFGLGALLVVTVRRTSLICGTAPLPPGWSGSDGFEVLARGGAMATLVVGPLELAGWGEFVSESLGAGGTQLVISTLMNVPLFAYAALGLLPAAGLSVRAGLGLAVRPGTWGRMTIIAASAVAASMLFTLLAQKLGLAIPGWREWFADLSQPEESTGLFVVCKIAVAPVLEELGWRGLLFATLRSRLGFWASASISALFFAALHGYGPAGTIDVFGAGVAFAWAFERSRSLYPAIIAHMAMNLLSCLQDGLL